MLRAYHYHYHFLHHWLVRIMTSSITAYYCHYHYRYWFGSICLTLYILLSIIVSFIFLILLPPLLSSFAICDSPFCPFFLASAVDYYSYFINIPCLLQKMESCYTYYLWMYCIRLAMNDFLPSSLDNWIQLCRNFGL